MTPGAPALAPFLKGYAEMLKSVNRASEANPLMARASALEAASGQAHHRRINRVMPIARQVKSIAGC